MAINYQQKCTQRPLHSVSLSLILANSSQFDRNILVTLLLAVSVTLSWFTFKLCCGLFPTKKTKGKQLLKLRGHDHGWDVVAGF